MSTATTRAPSTADPGREAQPHPLAGSAIMFRFMMRLDRVRAPVWFAAMVGLIVASAASVIALYHTPEQLANYAELVHSNVAISAILGRGYGLDDPTEGAVVMDEINLMTFIAVALMAIFLLVRHTRANEEDNRADLLRAAPVGRHTILAMASTWVFTIVLAIGVGITVGMIAVGLPTAGSVAFGAATIGVGLVYLAVAAVTAQVAASARAATSAAGAILGISYLLRAVGDMREGWLTWVSPLGWAQGVRAYADERWWMLLPLFATGVILLAVAFVLSTRRDLGAGSFAQRPGAPQASHWLSSPLALAARLQRGPLIGWTLAIVVTGLFMGSLADLADTLAENEAVAEMFALTGGSATDGFFATMLLMTGLLVAGFAVAAILTVSREESGGRADPILATPISRTRWLGSHVAVSALGAAGMLALAGIGTGLGYAITTGNLNEVPALTASSLDLLPGVLVLIAVAVALIGVVPKWSALAWLGVILSTIVGFLGETLQLPQWLRNLSPFEHLPAMPLEDFAWEPVALLLLVALVLSVGGLVALRRRDIDRT